MAYILVSVHEALGSELNLRLQNLVLIFCFASTRFCTKTKLTKALCRALEQVTPSTSESDPELGTS
jgi:hypothetical protein